MVLYLNLYFYPVLPETCFVAEGVEIPSIQVMVQDMQVTSFIAIDKAISEQSVPVWNCFGGSYPARTVEAVNADGTVFTIPVTWESKPEYNATIAGEYIFFPIIPEAYSVAEGVEVPSVKITVLADKLLLVGETPTRYPVQKNLRQLSKKSPMEMKPSIQLFSKKILT